MKHNNTIKALRLDNQLLAKVEALAKQEGRTFSGMVRNILVMFLKAHIQKR